MQVRELGMLSALGALWGGSYLFIRVAAPALGPAVLMAIRVIGAGLVLLAYAAAIRRLPDLAGRWRQYLLLGAVNAAVPFTLIATAAIHLTAAHTAILNATTPLFTAVVAAVWLQERFTPRKALGLAAGLAGVAVVVGWNPFPFSANVLLAAAACLLAALCYAVGGVYTKLRFAETPPLSLAIGQNLAAGLVLLPLAVMQPPAGPPTAMVVGAVALLVLLSTSVAYLLFFQLLRTAGPTRTLSVTYLVPVFGSFWGWLVLGEQPGPGAFVGLAIILISILMVTEVRFRSARQRSAGPAAESRS